MLNLGAGSGKFLNSKKRQSKKPASVCRLRHFFHRLQTDLNRGRQGFKIVKQAHNTLLGVSILAVISNSLTASSPSTNGKTRNPYWDAVRGIAIIAVIWIHTRTGQPYIDSVASWNFDYWVMLRQFLNFPVAIFFFLAGYFINTTRLSPLGPWLRRRAVRLIVPFLIWSLIYGIIVGVLSGESFNWIHFTLRIFSGTTVVHLYFIVVLVQLTLLTPWLVKAAKSHWGWLIFAITPIYIAVMYVLAYLNGSLPWWYAHVFTAWIIFYFAGLWARQRGEVQIKVLPAMILVICMLAVSIVEAYMLLTAEFPVGLATSQLSFTSIAYALSLVVFLLALKSRLKVASEGALIKVGNESYGIYYVHLVWILGTSFVIEYFTFFAEFPVLFLVQVLQVGLVLLLSVLSIWIARRIVGKKVANKYLGF